MTLPDHVVVDTNVATTANGSNEGAPPDCVAASARALQHVVDSGHVYVDDNGSIVAEYRRNLSAVGQPGPGDCFLKWLLTHEWSDLRVTRVSVTQKTSDDQDYEELPVPKDGTVFDPSDRKFLAIAAAHPAHPPILQAFDSKWWGWQAALREMDVELVFLCPDAIQAKYLEKMT